MKLTFYRSVLSGLVALLLLMPLLRAAVAAHPPVMLNIDLAHPPGRFVDIGGFRLYLLCRGKGTPTVILESGLGGFSLDWIYVQALLARDTRVCAYDRAGYGWSDPGPLPRTTREIAVELERLLHAADLDPPYILVGQSFGGYTVQYFAKRYPHAVAGVVLVDSSHPQQIERLPQLPALRDDGSHLDDLITFFNPAIVYRNYPRSMWAAMIRLLTSPKAVRTEQEELRGFRKSAAQVERAGPMPAVPLVVVTRGDRVWPDDPLGNAMEQAWADMQRDLAHSVPGARQVVARYSGHMVQLERPAVVADAVRSLLERYCALRYAQSAQSRSPRLEC